MPWPFDELWGNDSPPADPYKATGGFSSGFHALQTQQVDAQQKQIEEQQRQVEVSNASTDLGLFSGSLASTISAIPELFGIKAPVSVEAWRNEHPVADLVTTLAGSIIPYVGVEIAAAKIPGAARILEGATAGTLKAFGTTVEASPVIGGAVKEILKFTPLELSRLGTGWAVDADMGDMFADVAISQAIAGSLGGVGGFFRAGGKVAEKIAGKAADAELGMLPNFELRIAKDPESNIIGNMDRDQFLFEKQQEALKYVPETSPTGLKGRYVYDLDNASIDTMNWLEGLYKPNSSKMGQEALDQLAIDTRQLHTDGKAWSVGEGVGEQVAKKAGLEGGLSELADTMAYPRLVSVVGGAGGARDAGAFGGMLKKAIDEGALTKVDESTWIGREDGGLWHVVKRIERGVEPAKPQAMEGAISKRQPFQFGPAKVRQGDQFLIGKTDQPGKFVPEGHALAESTTKQWAKWKDPYRQLPTNHPFAGEYNLITKVLAPEDWQAKRLLRRDDWISRVTSRAMQVVKREGGLADQAQIQQYASGLYDIVAPKLAKMAKNPEYGRYLTLLEGGMKKADELLRTVMEGTLNVKGSQLEAVRGKNVSWEKYDGYTPVRELGAQLTPEELYQLNAINTTQTPAKDLKKLFADGTLSPKVEKIVTELQAINKNVLDKYVIPAFEEAGIGSEIRWLEGYIGPRNFHGDFFQRLTDETGKTKWLVSGTTPLEAQKAGQKVVEQAAEEGKLWKLEKVESKAMQGTPGTPETMQKIYNDIHESMQVDADAQEVVQRAYRKLLAERSSEVRNPASVKGGWSKARTGVPGLPDPAHSTLDNFVKAQENHYRQLFRMAAFHSWNYRFGKSALKWGKKDETAYNDLMRKATQWLGVEGPLTQQLNNLLKPVLGNLLGGKPATRIANEANKLMHQWNLGILNPSFAVLNLLQPLITTVPWISMMQKAPSDRVMEVSQMMLRYDANGMVKGTHSATSPIKLMGKAIRLMSKPEPELKEMFERAVQDGTLAPQIHDEWVGNHARSVHSIKEAAGINGWEAIKEIANLMSTRSEQFSRIVSFNSAYLLGKDFFGLEGDALYRFTRKGTETTMYGYGVMDRSRVLTGPLGSTWGLFKNWQFHFINDMTRYAGLGMKDGIWAPMLWQGASSLALGGLGATPLVALANGLARWNSDSPDSFSYMREHWGRDTGDALYFGLPALLGVSLQASSTMPGTDVMQDVTTLSNIAVMQRAQAIGKALGGAWDQYEGTGENPLKDPNIRDQMMYALAPRAAFRAYSVMEGDYIKSMATGMPTIRDVPPVTRLLHGIGLNTTDVEQYYIVGKRLYSKQQKERDTIQDLGNAFAQAQLAGDYEHMTGVINRAAASGVDVSSVIQSARTRYRRETQDNYLSKFSKQDQAAAMQVIDAD